VIALAAFATEGAIGFGGTVLAASIGAQAVALDTLLPAFVPLNMVLSTWLLLRGLRSVAWRMLAVEVAPSVGVGAAIGLALFHVPAKTALALAFGVFVAGLSAFRLLRPDDRPLSRPLRLGLLVLGGIAHGLFATGCPMIVYVVRRRLSDNAAFRSTLAVLGLALNAAVLINYATAGAYVREVGDIGIVLAITMVPGLFLGERVHRKLDAAKFERVVWVVLLLAGIALGLRSAWTL